ncbi:MAG: hypothetical protein IID45_00335 [Planctomycetes bacterium]|nr:hypothetical protein [Planctomycetota bacterium]
MKIVKAGRRTRSADRATTDPGIDRSTTAYSGFDDRGRYDGRRRDARQLRSPSSSRQRSRTQQYSPAQTARAWDQLQQRRLTQRVNGNRRFDDFPPASIRRFDDFPPITNRRSYAETELVSERGDGFRRSIPPDWQRSGSQNAQRDFAYRTTGYGRNDFTEVDRFSEVDRRPFETADPQFQRQRTERNRLPRPFSSEDQYRQERPTGDRMRTQQSWTPGIVRPVSHETPQLTGTGETPTPFSARDRFYLTQPEGDDYETQTVWERWKQRMSPGGVALQRMLFTATTLAGGRDKLGMFDFNAEASVIFPRHPGITIKPGFQALFPDGPTRTDLPPRLYSARLEFQLQFQVTQTIGAEVAVIPSLYGDFENLNSDSIRILGRVLGYYKSSPQTSWVLGLLYLDRDDVPFLPAFGMISTPRDDLRLELIFPRPKLMKRISRGAHNERWIYLMGEFGGDSWAVIRANGTRDQVNYKDWRLIFGFEQKYINGRSLLVETGYVFQRELEYVKGPGDFDPGETWMFRAGMVY